MTAKDLGRLSEAEAKFRTALKADPNNEKALYALAWTLVAEKKRPEAKTTFESFLKIAKDPIMKQNATAALGRLGK
ncbi:MAG TPA: tetratricopeptide repeat protein [Armatimonadota bacterium]|jgi:tetratricopeptide (TPR) repeat protein